MNTEEENAKAMFAAMRGLKPLSDEEMAKIQADNEERERRRIVEVLRQDWNAPQRHAATKIEAEGKYASWSERLVKSQATLKCGGIVAFVGTRGNGKTQMGVELMKIATRNQRSALFTTAMEFFLNVQAAYKSESKTALSVLNRYRTPKLLVVDEYGKRSESAWENNLLFELINKRYGDMNQTVLIDNRSRSDFQKDIAPSIADRMNEGGGIVEFNWESFRA